MVERIGVSLEKDLLDQFDRLIAQQGYNNRSEAIRDLIRQLLVEKEWSEEDHFNVASVVLVYDHHTLELSKRLTDFQHDHHELIISTLHVHMDHDNCMEILVLRGKTKEITRFGQELISTRGVKLGKFIPASTGKNL